MAHAERAKQAEADRQELADTVDRAVPRPIPSAPTIPPPPEHTMPPADRDFWIAITLWGGVFGTVFGYGLYALIERHYAYGAGFTALGLAGLVYLTAYLRGHAPRLTPRVGVLAALLAITWALITYQIWHEPTEIAAAPPPAIRKPNFVKDENIKRTIPGNMSAAPPVITYEARVSSGGFIRGYLEADPVGYIPMHAGPAHKKIELGSISGAVKNTQISFPIISSEIGQSGQLQIWWGTDKNSKYAFLGGAYQARIVITDEKGQLVDNFYFLIYDSILNVWDGGITTQKIFPDVITANYLDFAEKWEAADEQ